MNLNMSGKRKAGDSDEETDSKHKKDDVEIAKPTDESTKDEKVKIPSKGSENCGTLLICGSTNWDITGRKSLPKGTKGTGYNLWSPHQLGPMKGIRVRLVVSGSNACHSVIVTEDGQAMTFGRNEHGQLGHGDTVRRDEPTIVEFLKDENVVAAACGRRHTLFLTDQGTGYACGDNKMGQCGVGNSHPVLNLPTKLSYTGPPIIKVSCGGEFSVILDVKGNLHSFGCPEYGQLGHNTDGKYFVTANKLGYHFENAPKRIVFFVEKAKDGHISPVEVDEIIDVSCGSNHTVALDVKKRVFSWGWGGLGRLGHAEQKDEMIPRLVKFFETQSRGVKSIHCGNTYSLALNEQCVVYMFGQAKRTGEANMYPKPIQDLSGWNVRSVGCSFTSIVVAADESVISWGGSPTYGELGFGEMMKSTTVPKEVKTLEDVYIIQVSCGLGHTLFIARDKTEEERAHINNLPVFCP